jgi:glycosyltransferase involved in cell wall biosynthesis
MALVEEREAKRILVDAREFVAGRRTGIGRVLEGLVDAFLECNVAHELLLAVSDKDSIPARLTVKKALRIMTIPKPFIFSEMCLSKMTRSAIDVFISPYPKLPLFGSRCQSIHTINDVHDLTHPAYRKRPKAIFDRWRLKRALRTSDLTWYDSEWSMEETRKLIGFVGKSPRVRYPGISDIFTPELSPEEHGVVERLGLRSGYILVVGNGLPHKNLGVLLRIAGQISRQIVFAGVRAENQLRWKGTFPQARVVWIEHVAESDLPALMRGAFCLAQPSTDEGYGYPPLEAMACGVPAVVSDIPVLKETTGTHAVTADPERPGEWLKAFRDLENVAFYRAQVENGLHWAERLRGQKAWLPYVLDVKGLLDGR